MELRYYAPWLCRWLSPDPAGTITGLNIYAFVTDNPESFWDVGGMGKRKGKRKGKEDRERETEDREEETEDREKETEDREKETEDWRSEEGESEKVVKKGPSRRDKKALQALFRDAVTTYINTKEVKKAIKKGLSFTSADNLSELGIAGKSSKQKEYMNHEGYYSDSGQEFILGNLTRKIVTNNNTIYIGCGLTHVKEGKPSTGSRYVFNKKQENIKWKLWMNYTQPIKRSKGDLELSFMPNYPNDQLHPLFLRGKDKELSDYKKYLLKARESLSGKLQQEPQNKTLQTDLSNNLKTLQLLQRFITARGIEIE